MTEASNPYLNIDKYVNGQKMYGILSQFTKNPPNIIKGITKAGTNAVATSIFGIIVDKSNPYDTAY